MARTRNERNIQIFSVTTGTKLGTPHKNQAPNEHVNQKRVDTHLNSDKKLKLRHAGC